MKKFIAILAFSLCAFWCFSEIIDVEASSSIGTDEEAEEESSKSKSLFIDIGRSGVQTSQLGVADNSQSIKEELWANNTFVELGTFNTTDTGFIDFVDWSLVGFGYGRINTAQNYIYSSNDQYYGAISDANVFKLWDKGSAGLQLSISSFSIGAMIGFTSFCTYKNFKIADYSDNSWTVNYNKKYHGCDLGLYFSPSFYISLDILGFMKIMAISNIDLPILTTQYANDDRALSKWTFKFFNGDKVPSVMIGTAFTF